jgi:hypothetical protein
MKKQIYYRGTIFSLTHFWDYERRETFILSDYFDTNNEGILFQLICISGDKPGTICGYIRNGILFKENIGAITYDELINGIKYNFLKPYLETLVIEDTHKMCFK